MAKVPVKTPHTKRERLSRARRQHRLLHARVVRLAALWNFYNGTFGQEHVAKQMREVSRTGFGLVQDAILHDLIRSLCALSDQPGCEDRRNVSLCSIMDDLQAAFPPSKLGGITKLLEVLEKHVVALRAHRNKRLMHFDYDTLQTRARSLPKLLKSDLKAAVRLAGQFLSAVGVLLGRTAIAYDLTAPCNSVGEWVWMISDSLRLGLLRSRSRDPELPDSVLRLLLQQRSGRLDARILEGARQR